MAKKIARPSGTVDTSPAMSNTFVSVNIHFVFSTKNRRMLLTDTIRERVWSYMGGIARENRTKALCIGGIADHVHLLISMPATLSMAKAMQLIKAGTTTWIHESLPGMNEFAWQEGYGAFGVNESALDETIAYIQNQAVHHRSVGFQEEFVTFLKANRVAYNEKYLWD